MTEQDLEQRVNDEGKEKEKGLLSKITSYGLNIGVAIGATAIGSYFAGIAAPLLGLSYAGAHIAYDLFFNRVHLI